MTDSQDKIKLQVTGGQRKGQNNVVTAVILFGLVAGMTGLAFASDPLYRLFCKVTGYGGTTQVAETPPQSQIVDQMITVRFDANVNRSLPWRFKPVQNKLKVRLGEQAMAFFEATNVSDKPIVGTATFNVAPFKAGEYFSKIECFCFTEQMLKPGETVDPAILKDRNTTDVKTITLSYTFFVSDDQGEAKKLRTTHVIEDGKGGTISSREIAPKG
jgi:cytochrome c oxidase assembly protein subunit 11